MLERTTVETTCGPILGRRKEDVLLFAGVPYAAPPVGPLRFKAPQPHASWQAPREAFKFSPAAPQVSSGGLTDSANVRFAEDCLYLNISTPSTDGKKRPVLVWIHGGGYRTGQGSIPWYNGTAFNKNGDIVVVSINYRLGALGFADLSHLGEAYANSGVNGMLDQIAALHWVRDNISAFGGDPDRVTIAGESAGAFSVCTLLGCEAAQGLFHRAIAQSGGAQHTLPKAAAEKVTQTFLNQLLSEHDGVDQALALEAASVEDILAAQQSTISHFEQGAGVTNELGVAVSPFYPAHGTPLLPESPLAAIAGGCGRNVAVLTGSNAHETTLWGYGEISAEKLERIARSYGAESVLTTYRQARPDATVEDLLIALTTDHMFRIPAIRLAEARQPLGAQTWMYLFAWESRAFGGRLKATHALEIPFTFNNLRRAGVDVFLGPGEQPQALADKMHQSWIDFISGDSPGWPAYNTTTRATMAFNTESALLNDPDADERTAWAGLR
ncbi:MAG: carboxylesterase/lipase family protein [bacterium]